MRSRQAHVPGGPKCWENPTGGDALINHNEINITIASSS